MKSRPIQWHQCRLLTIRNFFLVFTSIVYDSDIQWSSIKLVVGSRIVKILEDAVQQYPAIDSYKLNTFIYFFSLLMLLPCSRVLQSWYLLCTNSTFTHAPLAKDHFSNPSMCTKRVARAVLKHTAYARITAPCSYISSHHCLLHAWCGLVSTTGRASTDDVRCMLLGSDVLISLSMCLDEFV
jgi:hypothetical protein